jgi:hypothetical protein
MQKTIKFILIKVKTLEILVVFRVSTVQPWSCQTKDYKIGICCFSDKHAALRRKNKDW